MTDPKDTIWWRLVNLQPSVYRGLIVAIISVLAAAGIKLSPDVPDMTLVVLLALLPLVQGIWTKGSVTPNAKVAVRVPDPINAPDEIEAGPAVVTDVSEATVFAAAVTEGQS